MISVVQSTILQEPCNRGLIIAQELITFIFLVLMKQLDHMLCLKFTQHFVSNFLSVLFFISYKRITIVLCLKNNIYRKLNIYLSATYKQLP